MARRRRHRDGAAGRAAASLPRLRPPGRRQRGSRRGSPGGSAAGADDGGTGGPLAEGGLEPDAWSVPSTRRSDLQAHPERDHGRIGGPRFPDDGRAGRPPARARRHGVPQDTGPVRPGIPLPHRAAGRRARESPSDRAVSAHPRGRPDGPQVRGRRRPRGLAHRAVGGRVPRSVLRVPGRRGDVRHPASLSSGPGRGQPLRGRPLHERLSRGPGIRARDRHLPGHGRGDGAWRPPATPRNDSRP